MTADPSPPSAQGDPVAELRRLMAAATPAEKITHTRYEHGGSRSYIESPRTLIADLYNEADREYWIALVELGPALLAVVEAADALAEECVSRKSWPAMDRLDTALSALAPKQEPE